MRLGTEVVVTTPADCLQLDMSSWMTKFLKIKAWKGLTGYFWIKSNNKYYEN